MSSKEDKMIGKLADVETVLYTVVKAVDELDRNECSQVAAMTAIASTLIAMGYGQVDSFASATMTVSNIEDQFRLAYWRGRSTVDHVATVMAAAKAAISNIEEGKINAELRHKTAEILAEQDGSSPGPTNS